MNKNEFIELVIAYGANGTAETESYTEKQQSIVAQAWAALIHAEESYGNEDSEEYCQEAYEAAESYYEDFIPKEFSTEWLKEEVRLAKEMKNTKNSELALHLLICDIENYIEHISKNAHRKGCGTSEKKAASSAANGAKGGRPKGSKNKLKE